MPDDSAAAPALTGPRKRERAERRLQLIEATIAVLATHGYARTTLTAVARQAGISHGLVNFHFDSKERLLSETLRYLTDEYENNWRSALAAAGPDAAAGLRAVLLADLDPQISAPDRLAAWCAFRGETQSRPIYQEACSGNDAAYVTALEDLCARLKQEGGYGGEPRIIARVLRAVTEVIWLDRLTLREPYGRAEAERTLMAACAAFFPQHFTDAGLRPR